MMLQNPLYSKELTIDLTTDRLDTQISIATLNFSLANILSYSVPNEVFGGPAHVRMPKLEV